MVRNKKNAFTLIEILIVLVLVSVIAAVGVRMVDSNENAKKFHATVERMKIIRDKIVGDERILQCGRRVDFGYFGKHGTFPPEYDPPTTYGLDALRSVWPTVNPFIRAHDAWNRRMSYDGPAGTSNIITIASAGANGSINAGDTGFNIDIDMEIDVTDYTSNDMYVFCKDVRGTLLLGIQPGTPATYIYPIWRVTVEANGETFSYPDTGGGLSMSVNGYWSVTDQVRAGQCKVSVEIADGVTDAGSNKYCSTNRISELSGNSFSVMDIYEMVNPISNFTTHNQSRTTVVEARFPGAIGEVNP